MPHFTVLASAYASLYSAYASLYSAYASLYSAYALLYFTYASLYFTVHMPHFTLQCICLTLQCWPVHMLQYSAYASLYSAGHCKVLIITTEAQTFCDSGDLRTYTIVCFLHSEPTTGVFWGMHMPRKILSFFNTEISL